MLHCNARHAATAELGQKSPCSFRHLSGRTGRIWVFALCAEGGCGSSMITTLRECVALERDVAGSDRVDVANVESERGAPAKMVRELRCPFNAGYRDARLL
jgi:hypothetical protein